MSPPMSSIPAGAARFARHLRQERARVPELSEHLTLKTQRTADGREVIKLKSVDPIIDPFVTVLIEVNWLRGHLVREYTMLMDPPVYTPGQSQNAQAPVAAPATSPGAREGSIARSTEAPMPAATPAPGEAAPEAPAAAAEPAAPAPAPAPTVRHSHASSPAPVAANDEGGSHTVQRGETLSGIASTVTGANVNSAQTRSWIVAIYNANPEAFRKNMNVMRSGAVLRIPDAADAQAISPAEASAEIHRQYTAWRSTSGESEPATAATTAQPGRLKLVTPTGPAAANSTPVAPSEPAAPAAAAAAATGAAAAAAAKEADAKRLLELKNQDLARMQAQNAAKQNPPAAAPEAAPPAATAPAPAPAPAAEQAPPEAAPAAAAPVQEQPKPVPVKPKAAAPASGGGFLDTLVSYWWILVAILALGLVGFLAARVLKSRRTTTDLDDSLSRLAAEGAESAEMGSMSATRGFSDPAPIPTPRITPVPVPESAFLVEETGSHERPRLSTTGTMPAMAAPKHVASDETISSETAINLDQGDPLAEADFHMAYGLYDQAADLIRIAISREPNRRDLKLKLLEVFFVWGNKEQFLASARELAAAASTQPPVSGKRS